MKEPPIIDSQDSDSQSIPDPTATIVKDKGGRLIPSRYICCLLGFCSFLMVTAQRLNLTMGMVAMINQTALQMSGDDIKVSECTAELLSHANDSTHEIHKGLSIPAISNLMSNWFPAPEKGVLSSITLSGFPGGAVVGGLLNGILCNADFLGGWPLVFYVFGLLGLILSFAVYFFGSNCPDEDCRITDSEYKYIMSNLDCQDTGKNGYLNSLPYIPQILVTWIASYVSDVLVNKGYASTDIVRKVCNTLSCCHSRHLPFMSES
ncbi:sialin [Trichonephila clavipes]|nr:sialin [Trichonephila clavipes]